MPFQNPTISVPEYSLIIETEARFEASLPVTGCVNIDKLLIFWKASFFYTENVK